MSKKTVSMLAIVLLALAAGSLALAEGPVQLRYQFKPGETLTYSMIMGQDMEISTSMAPGAAQKVSTDMDVEIFQKVSGVEKTGANLEVGFNKFIANLNMGGNKTPMPGMDDIKKIRMTMQMSDRGAMSAAKLINKEALSAQSQQMAESMTKSMTQNSLVFPDKALAVGESWSNELDVPSEIPGAPDLKMKVKSSYKLLGFDTVGGIRCAKVAAEVKLSLHGAGSQQGMPIQADMEGSGTGENLFAIKEGRMMSTQAKIDIAGDVKASANGQDVSSHLKIAMNLKMKLK